jgi:hypothetical protein
MLVVERMVLLAATGPAGVESNSANVIDGTAVTRETKVAIRNCEPIATLARRRIRAGRERSDTLAADDSSF